MDRVSMSGNVQGSADKNSGAPPWRDTGQQTEFPCPEMCRDPWIKTPVPLPGGIWANGQSFHCKGSSALGHEIGHFRSFQSSQSCHASPLISDIATNSLVFPHVSISPRIYAFFILPSISQFVVPCLIIFLFLPPSSDAPRRSSHSDFGATTFQDRSAVSNCNADGLKPSFLASCFLHHPSTIRSFYRFHRVLLTPLVFHLGRSTSCLS